MGEFDSTVDYAALPKRKLIECFHTAIAAHANFFGLWQEAVRERFDAATADELTAIVYPNVARLGGDLKAVFYEELNFLWSIMPNLSNMLTFATYDASLLPETLDQSLDPNQLTNEALVLLWNVSPLTYVMQTGRWVDTITAQHDQRTALQLEKEVWLDRGGAEEDLRYGLIAAGNEKGDVGTLLRGFQMAPGEVGLVDATFDLEDPHHGWITHRRCPAHERFRDGNRERLEHSCVICVIAMRLSGEMVNDRIRCRPASLPPHRKACDHACRWEYWLE